MLWSGMCRMFTRQPMRGGGIDESGGHQGSPGNAPLPRQAIGAAVERRDLLHREYALGRKLTKAEVKRFVEKNILTLTGSASKHQPNHQPTNNRSRIPSMGSGSFSFHEHRNGTDVQKFRVQPDGDTRFGSVGHFWPVLVDYLIRSALLRWPSLEPVASTAGLGLDSRPTLLTVRTHKCVWCLALLHRPYSAFQQAGPLACHCSRLLQHWAANEVTRVLFWNASQFHAIAFNDKCGNAALQVGFGLPTQLAS